MIGLIVVATDRCGDIGPDAMFGELLGVPVLARAAAAALPTDSPVRGVLVVPDGRVDEARSQIADRFGLVELDQVISAGPGVRAAVEAGLASMPDDVDTVIVQRGADPLVPTGYVDGVLAAAESADAAAPCAPAPAAVVSRAEDGSLAGPSNGASMLQGPQVFKRSALQGALEAGGHDSDEPALWVVAAGGRVNSVDGDSDNRRLASEPDLSRALEVFARRAVEYAFLFPKDLLPADPLGAAMQESDGPTAPEAVDTGDGAGA